MLIRRYYKLYCYSAAG